MNKKTALAGFVSSVGLVVVVLLIAVGLQAFSRVSVPNNDASSSQSATPKPTDDANPAGNATCKTWETSPSDYTNTRWIGTGLASIRDAKTNEEAAAAAADWLDKVQKDPILLAAATKQALKRDVDPATLSDKGCATDAAVALVVELQLTFGSSVITAGEAPANGYNTGVENGVVVGSPDAGVGGDRAAIKFTLPDGSVFWVMARCGNIVTEGPHGFPPGKTDNPPVTPPVTPPQVCSPDMPNGTWPVCKDESSVEAGPIGNAPDGAGTNFDPGPGTYVPPAQMDQPPAAPRVNPAPPAPAPAPAPAPVPVGSTPDPAPAPAPEPAAPTPDAPAEGCSPPLGMTTC